jgi:hypothetical protein
LGGIYVLTILYLPSGLMGIPELIQQRRSLWSKGKTTKQSMSVPP